MENRRLFTFLLTSLAFLYIWNAYVGPKFFPPPKRAPAAPLPVAANEPAAANPEAAGDEAPAAAVEIVVADHPPTRPVLGSLDPASGYALQVQLTSVGGAVETVQLTSPQFRDLRDQKAQATIVGTNLTSDHTLSTAVQAIDRQLAAHDQTLESAHWKLVSESADEQGATAVFEYLAPDQSLLVRKTFHLPRLTLTGDALQDAWRSNPSFYTLKLTLELINQSAAERSVDYDLQGPVGVLLENSEHAFKYRDIHLEFVDGQKPAYMNAGQVAGFCDDLAEELARPATTSEQRAKLKEDQEWVSAVRYAGVDVQFFAALLAPLDNRPAEQQLADKWLDRTYPVMIDHDTKEPRHSDISIRMASRPVTLAANGGAVKHEYALFVGPKHRELLDPAPLAAGAVLNYGWFGPVARVMMFLLDTFHRRIGLPYFLAIVSLTVLVRGCLFPLSRKQAISAARMKELQPQITALKEKYGDDREKLARAQMELWRKNKINPLGGCLPLFLQLPIFIGLYTALNAAVDLRLQKFLWIDNLAAPDALRRLPFAIPLFGLGSDFNVLPIVTVALFLVQQKLFMPPAQDEQQEMQYKMMNIMTGVMGFMFWHQPAGLCIYFIASSMWSIAERKLLGTGRLVAAGGPGVEVIEPADNGGGKSSGGSGSKSASKSAETTPSIPARPGFLQKLLDAAQEAREQADRQRERGDRKDKDRNGKRR
jgi:YidC/Oxa1 family membrane protein insertase